MVSTTFDTGLESIPSLGRFVSRSSGFAVVPVAPDGPATVSLLTAVCSSFRLFLGLVTVAPSLSEATPSGVASLLVEVVVEGAIALPSFSAIGAIVPFAFFFSNSVSEPTGLVMSLDFLRVCRSCFLPNGFASSATSSKSSRLRLRRSRPRSLSDPEVLASPTWPLEAASAMG